MVTEINRNSLIAVGTSAVLISDMVEYPRVERKVISIVNTSTAGQVITLAFGTMAEAGKGVQLAVGGFYQESHDAGFTPTQDLISAISSAAAGQVSIQERKLVK